MQEAVVGLHQNLAHGRTQIVTNASIRSDTRPADAAESPQAWLRLVVALAFATIGSVGVWSFIVSLPAVQADFGVDRADASLPYTCLMIGFALGGVLTGRLADRFGIVVPLLLGALSLTLGYIAAALAGGLWQLALVHGTLIGIGTSTTFGPLVADISHWFTRRRGIAVAICASGGYFAGTIWPPIVRHFVDSVGWRHTHLGIGVFCAVTLFPLALLMRKRTVMHADGTPGALATGTPADFGLSPGALQLLLSIAGVACCVAMAMPQVHLVAYCGDLGYGVARGAEMLSVMLAFGIVSRIGSGWIADHIGGVRTLLLGSVLQGVALLLYLLFDDLFSLYVISALFGLFQGGIVPSYAIIIREYFSPREAGTRLGIVLTATLLGMALGGWMSGAIFDFAGSYRMAFANGLAWNLLNVSIGVWLLLRSRGRGRGRMAYA
jgi:MFS family permease